MKKKTILIIDDEGDILKVVETRLQVSGYTVLTLKNASRALEIAKKKSPDIILLDIVMPERNGCEVCKELKSDHATKDIPIILFTAHYPEKNFIDTNYADFGANDCISKPYDPLALLEKIERLIK